MPSLAELQQRFADALYQSEGATPEFAVAGAAPAERMDIYRRAVIANYRKALAATYPTVQRVLGESEFAAAADAYVRANPSTSGDLNDYGGTFGAFLAGQPLAAVLPWLADVARLEWAIDEVNRAADAASNPKRVLESLATVDPERLPVLGLRIAAPCRLVASAHPILRIWQANAPREAADARVLADAPGDMLVVRRDPEGILVERLPASDFAWLAALAAGGTLAEAIDAAREVDAAFDLGPTLHAQIGNGTITALVEG